MSANLLTMYHVSGPGSGVTIVGHMDDALKVGSRMIALPPQRLDPLRRRLSQGLRAGWGYGFCEVWIEPQQYVRHYSKWYRVMAWFDEHDTDAANRYMALNCQASLLCIQDGLAYLAHRLDEGTSILDITESAEIPG